MATPQMHITFWILLLALTARPSVPLQAQDQAPSLAETPIRFEQLDGLSHNTVTALLQDQQGFLWIGTSDGLNRYDGYEFVVYRHDPHDSTSLSNDDVVSLLEDQSGDLWISTANGLSRFDRRAGRFIRYTLGVDSLNLGAGPSLYDHTGHLWVGTRGAGLFKYDRQADRFNAYRHDPEHPRSLASNDIRTLFEGRSGTLWVMTADQGLQRTLHQYDAETDHFLRFPVPQEWRDPITVYEDEARRLWIGHGQNSGGAGAFDQVNQRFVELPEVPSEGRVMRMLMDRKGARWLGTAHGLYKSDPAANGFQYTPLGSFAKGHLSNWVTGILEDRAGALWVGTLSGLFRLDPNTKRFEHLGHDPTTSNSISNAAVMSVVEERDGTLWLGTFGGGLNQIDRHTGQVTLYPYQPGLPNSLCSQITWSLLEDRHGTLWIGGQGGLCALNRRTGQFTAFELPRDPSIENLPEITAIREDGQGQLWMASLYGIGLYRMNPETGALTYYQPPSDQTPSLYLDAQSLAVGHDGTLWIGSTQYVLYRFDPNAETFQAHPLLQNQQKVGTSEAGIWAIHEDTTGMLWLGSSLGLTRFDPFTGALRHYTRQDGLPGSIVYAILADDQQRLWLGTNQGLACFDDRLPEHRKFSTYDTGDGLQNTEFNRRAAFKSASGKFFFGGLKGLTSFFPEQIKDNPYIPPVVITRIQKSNRDTTVFIHPDHLEHLRLSYQDYTFSFEFAALNYTNPQRNQYAYMLADFDEDWIDAGTRRFAQYTNIPSGAYVFRVKASNNDGLWNEEGTALRLTITPPFWQTWWFRTLAGLLLLVMMVSLVRYVSTRKLRRQVRELELQQQVQRERERISRDLHDHVGAKLSNMITGIELITLSTNAGEVDDLRPYLTMLDEDVRLTMAQLRETIWTLHHDAVSLETLGEQLRRYVHAQKRYSDRPALHCQVLGKETVVLSPVQTLHLFRIAQEAITNALKYANADNLYVTLQTKGMHRVELIVRDDGTFRQASSADTLGGFGLEGMQRRTRELGGTFSLLTEGGTTVQVSVPVR